MKRDIDELRRFVQSDSARQYINMLQSARPDALRIENKARASLLVSAAIWLAFSGWAFCSHLREPARECLFVLTAQPVEARISQAMRNEEGSTTVTCTYEVDGKDYATSLRSLLPHDLPRTSGPAGPIKTTGTSELIGERMTLYFLPADPSDARLSRQPRETFDLPFAVFLGPFVAVGLVMLWIAVSGRLGIPIARAGSCLAIYLPLSATSGMALFMASMLAPPAWALAAGVGMLVGYPIISALGGGLAMELIYRVLKAKASWQLKSMEKAQLGAVSSQKEGDGPAFGSSPEALPSAIGVVEAQLSPDSIWHVPKPGRLKGGTIGLLFFTIFWCAITGTFVGMIVHAFYMHAKVQASYVATQGTVVSSRLVTSSGSDGTTYRAEIQYAYSVNDQSYNSSRYAYGEAGSSDYPYHQGMVSRHPRGTKVTVYYDPDKPSEAVLSQTVQQSTYFMTLFMQPFLVIGLGLLGYTLSYPALQRRVGRFMNGSLQLPCRIPTWGELREDLDGLAIRPGGRALWFLGGMVGGYLLTTFLLSFVVVFLLGGFEGAKPSTIAGALAVAAVMSVLAGLLAMRVPSRKAAIVIDRTLRSLRVTSPKRNEELPLDRIDCWLLRMIDNPRNWGSDNDTKQAPMLLALSADGREIPVHVFRPNSSAPAVARRAAQCFAELTDRPLRFIDSQIGCATSAGNALQLLAGLGLSNLSRAAGKPAERSKLPDLNDLT